MTILTSLKAFLFPSAMPGSAGLMPAPDGGGFAALLSGTLAQAPAAPVDSVKPAIMNTPQTITPSIVEPSVSTDDFWDEATSRPPLTSLAEPVRATTGPVTSPIAPDSQPGDAGRAAEGVSHPAALTETHGDAPATAETRASPNAPGRTAITFVLDAVAASPGPIERLVATSPERTEQPVDIRATETPALTPAQGNEGVERARASESSPSSAIPAAQTMATPIKRSPSPKIVPAIPEGDAIVKRPDAGIARGLVGNLPVPARRLAADPADATAGKPDGDAIEPLDLKDAPGAPGPDGGPVAVMIPVPANPVGPHGSKAPDEVVAASPSSVGVRHAISPGPASAPDRAARSPAMGSDDDILPDRKALATLDPAAAVATAEALDVLPIAQPLAPPIAPPVAMPIAQPVVESEAAASPPAVLAPMPGTNAPVALPVSPLIDAPANNAAPAPLPGRSPPEKLLAASDVMPPAMPPRPDSSGAGEPLRSTGNITPGMQARPLMPAAPLPADQSQVSKVPPFAPIPAPGRADPAMHSRPDVSGQISKPHPTTTTAVPLPDVGAGGEAPDLATTPAVLVEPPLPGRSARPLDTLTLVGEARAPFRPAAVANGEGLAQGAVPPLGASTDGAPTPAPLSSSGADKPVRFEALSLLQLVRDQFRGRSHGEHGDGQVPTTGRVGVADRVTGVMAADIPLPSSHQTPLTHAPALPSPTTAPQAAAPVIDLSASIGTQLVDMGVSGQWIDGLARDIAGLTANGAQGRYQIDTEQLGRVQVDIRRDVEGMAVSLTVATEAAESALRKDRDRLQVDAGTGAARITELKIERAPPVEKSTAADAASQQARPQDGSAWQSAGQGMGQSAGQGRWQARENFAPAHKAGAEAAVLNHADIRESAADGARRDAGGTRYA